jgi:thiamine-phosphate pyrophosphorylase
MRYTFLPIDNNDTPLLPSSPIPASVFRMLDANLNRALEALRTLEDVARFHQSSPLQAEYKGLRHSLQQTTARWDAAELLRSRDAQGDVGRTVKTESELHRASLKEVADAASQRLQQSLRCLEEVSKVAYPQSASSVEHVRYQAYDLNARLGLALVRDREFLLNSKLYVLVDCQLPLDQFADRIRHVSLGGADLIQIRDKAKDGAELIAYIQAANQAVESGRTKVIVNDRADVAKVSQAWGVHVGQTDLSVANTRSIVSADAIVGLSTHDMDQVHLAEKAMADYIGCGPVFSSHTKAFHQFSGLAFLRQVSAWKQKTQSSLPTFAIGGITIENLPAVVEAGIRQVAVSGAVWQSDSPSIAASKLRDML